MFPLDDPPPFTTIPIFGAKKVIYEFECPMCKHRVRNDADMEPMCTGPFWTDDHEMVCMTRIP